ncbi:MAG: TPM domain-containing protein, partial [Polyangiaceae bacterium]
MSRWARVLAAALLAVAFFAARPSHAAAKLALPPLDGHVVDTSGTLSRDDVLYLDHRLEAIRLQSGFAIVALVVGPLQGEPIEDVAYTAFNTWQIGQKGKDDGVLIVVAPSDRRVRIETGKGVGGALTDLQSNDIIRNDMSPLLRQGRLRDAIEAGASAVAKDLVAGTPGATGTTGTPRGPPPPALSPLGMGAIAGGVLLVIVLLIVSPGFRSVFFTILQMFFLFGGRG